MRLLLEGDRVLAHQECTEVLMTGILGIPFILKSPPPQESYITNITAFNGYLWAAVAGGGIWKRPLSELGMSSTLDQDFLKASFNLSPNPASQLVKVQIGEESGELILFDVMGRVVLRRIIESPETELSVEGLPQGLYQVIFMSEKRMFYGSLVVQR